MPASWQEDESHESANRTRCLRHGNAWCLFFAGVLATAFPHRFGLSQDCAGRLREEEVDGSAERRSAILCPGVASESRGRRGVEVPLCIYAFERSGRL